MADTIAQELLDFDKAMEEAAKTKKLHQAAFRAAFNFLEQFYPPRDDEEYWVKMAETCVNVTHQHEGNPLIIPLMLTMMDYLGEVWKERQNGKTA